MCGESVLDSHKAVCYDLCDFWVHVDCDESLSVELYDEFLATPTSDPWFCSKCCDSVQYVSLKDHCGLSCLCLNARSILPKRHDLFALIFSFNVDIVAVIETFLDSSILDAEVCPKNYVIFCKDRTRHGGGVFIIVRDHLKVLCRDDLNLLCDELLLLEISGSISSILLPATYCYCRKCT